MKSDVSWEKSAERYVALYSSLVSKGMILATEDRSSRKQTRLAVLFNRSEQHQVFTLPSAGEANWRQLVPDGARKVGGRATVEPRSVAFFVEN